jgi:hypothetical protein
VLPCRLLAFTMQLRSHLAQEDRHTVRLAVFPYKNFFIGLAQWPDTLIIFSFMFFSAPTTCTPWLLPLLLLPGRCSHP